MASKFQVGDTVKCLYASALQDGVIVFVSMAPQKPYKVMFPDRKMIWVDANEIVMTGHKILEPIFNAGDIVRSTEWPKKVFRIIHATGTNMTGVYTYRAACVSEEADRQTYTLNTGCLYLNEAGTPEELITIRRDGNTTRITRRLYGVLKGEEIIHKFKDDDHNMHKAAIYALDKLFKDGLGVTIGWSEPKPEYYNGFVTVISSDNPVSFPVGHVFRFANGQSCTPCHIVFPGHISRVKSFTDLQERYPGIKFLELKL